MSVRNDVVNLIVNINGNQAQNQLNELRKRSVDIKNEMQGLKRGTEEYIAKAKELKDVSTEMDKLKQSIGLTALSQKELTAELNKLKAMKGSIQPFTKEFNDLQHQIETVEARLYDVKNGVQGFASFLSKIKDEVKQFGLMAAGALGFQFITSQLSNIINGGGKLSDQLADIRRVTGLTADEVKGLNKQLGELDTRTSTEGLRNIAIVAGKLGVAKEDILGFVAATDKLVVALGDELGNADEITTNLGKIINVFDKGDGKVTGEKLTSIGNAIVDLANKGVASGGFVVDFTQRLAGLAKTANLALPDVLALGAGLEESGQKVESSATAISKVLGQIGADVPKFAGVAGKSIEEFSKTLREKPVEAIIQVSEGFTKGKNSFEDISKAFANAGEDGAKIVSTLGVIGGKADFFRRKIDETGVAIKETGEIQEAFRLKNETLGATLDKTGKEFNKLMASSAVSSFLKGAVEGLYQFLLFLKDLPNWLERNRTAIIAVTGVVLTYAASKLTLTAASLKARLALLGENIVFAAQYTWLVISEAATKAYAFMKGVLTGRITIATAAQRLWNLAMLQNPVMWVVAGIAALATAISFLTSKYDELTTKQRVANELQRKTLELTSDEEIKANTLYNTLTTGLLPYEQKKKLVAELIAINPQYLSGLTAENVLTLEGSKIMSGYIAKLREANQEKARQALIAEKEKQIQQAKLDIGDVKLGIGDANPQVGALMDGLSYLGIGKGTGLKQLNDAAAGIKKLDDELKELYNSSAKAIAATATTDGKGAIGAVVDNSLKAEIARLEAKKKELETARGFLNKNDEKGDFANLKKQEDIQKRIDYLNGKKDKTSRGDNKIAALRKQFDELMGNLNIAEAKATMDELEVKFEQINKKLKDEQALITKALAAGAVTPEEAKGAMARVLKVAIEEFDKATEDFKDKLAKKRGIALTLKVELAPLDETKAQQPIKNAISTVQRILAKMARDSKAKLQLDVLLNPVGSGKNTNGQLGLLELEKQEKLKNADLTENEILLIEAEYAQRKLAVKIAAFQAYADYTIKAATSINALLNSIENRQLQQEVSRNDKKKKELDKQLKGKLISQEQYNLKTDALDNDLDKKKKKLAYDQAKRQKAIDIAAGLSSTALAVIGFLSAKPVGPWNFIQAAIAGAIGLANVATIATAPLPELGTGGWITEGDKHSDKSGGINAKIERDEAVINAATMTDKNVYTATGTPAQITSALNGLNGVSWAPGATINTPKWRTDAPKYISSEIPKIMALGGVAYSSQTFSSTKPTDIKNNETASSDNDTATILKQILDEQKRNNNQINDWQTQLQIVFSMKEYDRQKGIYDTAKKQSGISR